MEPISLYGLFSSNIYKELFMKKFLYLCFDLLFVIFVINNSELLFTLNNNQSVNLTYFWFALTCYAFLKLYGLLNWPMTLKLRFVLPEIGLFVLSFFIINIPFHSWCIDFIQIALIFFPLTLFAIFIGIAHWFILNNLKNFSEFWQKNKKYKAAILFIVSLFICPPLLTINYVYSPFPFIFVLLYFYLYVFLPHQLGAILINYRVNLKQISFFSILLGFVLANIEIIVCGFYFSYLMNITNNFAIFMIIIAALRIVFYALMICSDHYKEIKSLMKCI